MTVNYPPLVFVVTFALLMFSIWVGQVLQKRAGGPKEEGRADAGLLASAILTLLFLLIGFSFSMAINRYDLRKTCEQAEAVAIGTLYTRADLLAPADAAKVQGLLKTYVAQLLSLYTARPNQALDIRKGVLRSQAELWATLRPALATVAPPLLGLFVQGLNDVVSAQRSTQGAWQNHIPAGAWVLLFGIAVSSCWLIGFRARHTDWLAFTVVPIAVAISFYLIAELDSPRGGFIRVTPLNLTALVQTLETP
jgi:hypothetical protein